jgi:hypothetical protein
MIKPTLIGLVVILVCVISVSYYVNKEGFDDISNSSLNSVIKTVTPTVTPTATPDSTVPTRTDVVPEVTISGSGYNAMNLQQKAELLKDIQKLVKNEVLIHRNTTPIIPTHIPVPSKNTSECIEQGKEYTNGCHKKTDYRCPLNPDGSCPPVPDMSQYIKKNQIPCWGCSLDY